MPLAISNCHYYVVDLSVSTLSVQVIFRWCYEVSKLVRQDLPLSVAACTVSQSVSIVTVVLVQVQIPAQVLS